MHPVDPHDEHDPAPPTLDGGGPLRLGPEELERLNRARAELRGVLVVIDGNAADIGVAHVIADTCVIGRHGGDLQLRDGRVSRRHAIVDRRGAAFFVRDAGSSNGTLVNGQRTSGEVRVERGDKIVVGETVVEFSLVDAAQAEYLLTIDRLVGTDDLTGLISKTRFDAALEQALRVARHGGRPLCVLMMDMDRLKQINDALGHHAGAGSIRRVGELLRDVLGRRGEACRFGGDEFSAFLPDADLARGKELGELLRAAVEDARLPMESAPVHATISIGVAQIPPAVQAVVEALDLADKALYRAKAAGRNCVSD